MRRGRFRTRSSGSARINYSLYLMHPLLVVTVVHWANRPLAFVVVAVGSLVLAEVTFRFVELPFQGSAAEVQARAVRVA